MENELEKIITKFYEHIEWFNRERKESLEDDIEPTFDNFFRWLQFENDKIKPLN